jgi:dTDP-4-amino-4,6-dideoxygalactose transaminase
MIKMQVPMFDLRVTDLLLKEELLEAVAGVLDHGKLFLGPEVEEFEEKIARYVGTKYALGVGSGSSALYMSLKACGIDSGDEVITTPLTWIISSNAIRACGAIPVFADVRDDFNIDPKSIEQAITSRTRAILPVHYAGHMCDMAEICSIATANNLIVVEDAAQAFGASLQGKKAGSFSLAAGLSMNPMKVLGGYGEAGVVVTNDEIIYKRLRQLRHAGTTSDPKKLITNDCREISLNHKMDTINAALLLIALKYLSQRLETRAALAKRYHKEMPPSIKHQESAFGERHARYVYPIRTCLRDEVKSYLESYGVETKIMHEPLVCDAPAYKQYRCDVPNARRVLKSSLVIPSHEKISSDQATYVIDLFREFEGKRVASG